MVMDSHEPQLASRERQSATAVPRAAIVKRIAVSLAGTSAAGAAAAGLASAFVNLHAPRTSARHAPAVTG
jgi:hypothetical protein